MPAGIATHRWFASPASLALLSREFEDGTVCFDPHTGETRLLAALTWFMLERLIEAGSQGLAPEDVVAQVLAADDSQPDACFAGTLVDATFDELLRAGLVNAGEPS
jgi:hypothetical protein